MHEKVFDIINNEGNVNQNHNDLTLVRMAVIKKTGNNKC